MKKIKSILALLFAIFLLSCENNNIPMDENQIEGYIVGIFAGYKTDSETGVANGYTERGYCIKLENENNSPMDFYTFNLPENLFDFPPVTGPEYNGNNCGPVFFENSKQYKIKFSYRLVEEKDKNKFVPGPCLAMDQSFPWREYNEVSLQTAEKIEVENADLQFSSTSLGCASFLVYKMNDEKDMAIAVRGNREKLNLSTTEKEFNLNGLNTDDLSVEIREFTPDSRGYYCDCVFEGEVLGLWRSMSGKVKIKIVQDYVDDIQSGGAIYKIEVKIDDVMLIGNRTSIIFIKQLEFNDVSVGWFPG